MDLLTFDFSSITLDLVTWYISQAPSLTKFNSFNTPKALIPNVTNLQTAPKNRHNFNVGANHALIRNATCY